ncbi:MAG: TonB-dependent receptor, partial [Bacteroidales bacterium]|nr:TonB-dependent receptor [Bacteroidales bacterium]
NTTGIFSNKAVVTMRGMPANEQGRTLVIMDGVPMNKADGGSVNWNLLNKNNISEINVIKGPGPAKYGSGAMGGVIELITMPPSEKFAGHVNFEYGSFNTFGADANLSGNTSLKKTSQNFFWNLTANGKQSDGYINTPEEFQTIEDTILVPSFLKEFAVGLKTGFDFGNNHIVELQGQFFDDMRGNGVQVFDNFGAYSKHKTLSTLVKYKGMSNFFKWQINVFNNSENYFRIYEYMREGEYKLYEADALRNDMGLQLDAENYNFDNHKISFGFNMKSGSVNGSDTYFTSTDIINNAGKMDIWALYLQDEISLIKQKLFFNAGIRYDYARFYDAHFSIDYPSYSIAFYDNFETLNLPVKSWDAFSPRLSLRYNRNENSRLFVSYARGFRAPTLDDLSRTGSRKGTFVIANPDLKPEILNAFEIGGDMQFCKNLLVSLSLFHSMGQDFMYYTSTGDTVNMGYRLAPIISKNNIGKVGISGVEAETKYVFNEKINFFFNYTFTHAVIIQHNVLDVKIDSNLTGNFLTDIPQHKFSSGLRWYHKIVNTSVLAKYQGETWINEWNTEDTEYFFTDKFEDYIILNIRFEKTFAKYFTTSLQFENILDTRFVDGSLQECPGRMIFVGLKIGF